MHVPDQENSYRRDTHPKIQENYERKSHGKKFKHVKFDLPNESLYLIEESILYPCSELNGS